MNDFNARMIRIGVITLCAGIIANFIPVMYLWGAYGIIPPLHDIFKIWMLAAVTFAVSWVVQPITFFSLLGTAGSYIGWLAGSVADIRSPAVTMAQKAAGYEAGTPEGDVMAIIGITGSILLSVSVLTIFSVVGANVIEMVPPFVRASFKVILPAVFSAVYVQLASKHLKMGASTIFLAILVTFIAKNVIPIPGWIVNISIIIIGMLVARVQYVKWSK